MQRSAVFVDAGYLFAQGSTLLTGKHQGRETLSLDVARVIEVLKGVAQDASGLPLLRIYWYDGMRAGRASAEQTALAEADDVKIRLGQINSVGEQKGVDALIVTDMIELGRNQAIADAVLLSGDEDVRIGVVLAQQFGVRVHLVGIHPTRGNQARSLMQEADTRWEWDEAVVRSFLAHAPPAPPVATSVTSPVAATASGLDAVVTSLVAALKPADFATLKGLFATSPVVPPEHDKLLLKAGRAHYGQTTLTNPERAMLRAAFIRLVLAR